jgi:hypothetical protein
MGYRPSQQTQDEGARRAHVSIKNARFEQNRPFDAGQYCNELCPGIVHQKSLATEPQ